MWGSVAVFKIGVGVGFSRRFLDWFCRTQLTSTSPYKRMHAPSPSPCVCMQPGLFCSAGCCSLLRKRWKGHSLHEANHTRTNSRGVGDGQGDGPFSRPNSPKLAVSPTRSPTRSFQHPNLRFASAQDARLGGRWCGGVFRCAQLVEELHELLLVLLLVPHCFHSPRIVLCVHLLLLCKLRLPLCRTWFRLRSSQVAQGVVVGWRSRDRRRQTVPVRTPKRTVRLPKGPDLRRLSVTHSPAVCAVRSLFATQRILLQHEPSCCVFATCERAYEQEA